VASQGDPMSPISTRNLDDLPDVGRLKALLQSLAVLDAIMSLEWGYRYYSFSIRWSRNEQMGSMRNGSGDEFFALFNRAGCFIKGFAHGCRMSPYRNQPPEIWPGMLDDVPDDFSSGLDETAFSMNNVTFCIWRRYTDDSWLHGPIKFPDDDDPDGSTYLLEILDGDPRRYQQFAEEYYGSTISIEAVRYVYDHLALTDSVVKALNPDATVKDLANDLIAIGYPTQKTR
jgi:hypothetical protein